MLQDRIEFNQLRSSGKKLQTALFGGDAMSDPTRSKKVKPVQFFAFSVLVGIVLTSALVPLKPVMQQALIGFTLAWIGVTAMVGI
jgi:hypothetical protein